MSSSVEIAKGDLVSGAFACEIRALLDQRRILLFRGVQHRGDAPGYAV
jgi:hypothetical protein